MPGMDGCTATREIRRREGATRHTPIIGLTARALASDREDCLRAGMDDYLSKPVSPEDLGAKIDKWVMALSSQRTLAPEVETVSTDASLTAPCGAPTPLAEASLDGAVLAELREYQKPGEPDFVTELIGIFKGDLTNRLSQMRAGLQAGDASGYVRLPMLSRVEAESLARANCAKSVVSSNPARRTVPLRREPRSCKDSRPKPNAC